MFSNTEELEKTLTQLSVTRNLSNVAMDHVKQDYKQRCKTEIQLDSDYTYYMDL